MKNKLFQIYKFIFLRQNILTKVFFVVIFFSACTYSVLLVKTIHTISERKELRTEIRNTQARISEHETKYFELATTIDSAYVLQHGFTEVRDPVFAHKDDVYTNTATFALNTTKSRLK